jgi:hypothetical protein
MSGERKVREQGFPRLDSPFLTGNPSKGESQLEHLFKTAGRDDLTCWGFGQIWGLDGWYDC